MERLWSPLLNPFIRAIRESAPDASEISQFTADTLTNEGSSNAAIAALAATFSIVNTAFQTAFQQRALKMGQQKMATANINDLQDGLKDKVNAWDLAIQGTGAIKGSPAYLEFFPNGHAAFTSARRSDRLGALTSLHGAMEGKPALAMQYIEVQTTLDAYNSSNAMQTSRIDAKDALSDAIDDQEQALAVGLYDVLGGLMRIFKDDPSNIERFYRLDLIRRKAQTDFTGSVPAFGHRFIVQRKMKAGEQVSLQNDGDVTLIFFFASEKDTVLAPGMSSQSVLTHTQVTIPGTAIGASDTNVYLIVQNEEALNGHWMVAL